MMSAGTGAGTSPATTGHGNAVEVLIDLDGVHLPAAWTGVLEVAFDGRRIWPIRPERHPVGPDGRRHIAWPADVLDRLDGVAEVAVRHFDSGEVCWSGTVAFGSGTGRIDFTNAAGDLLEVNKWGHLAKSFASTSDETRGLLLEGVERVLTALRDEIGVPAFISYGMLLGAVREGRLIGHDGDADVSYVSRHDHPTDVLREAFEVERYFRRLGWRTARVHGGFLQVFVPTPSGAWINIDIYSCAFIDGNFYQVGEIMAPLPRGHVLPPSEVTLEGHTLPAPARPERILELSYGPGWRVPDPSFTFSTPRQVARRFHGWWGGYRVRGSHWTAFHNGPGRRLVPRQPSAFALWVHARESALGEPAPRLVDVGCGNGRDAVFFARQGYEVLGFDYSDVALRQSRRLARRRIRNAERRDSTRFERIDLGDLRQTLIAGSVLARDSRPVAMYARFLLSALEDPSRRRLWRMASMALRGGGRLYLEFRTPKDAGPTHRFPAAHRRFVDPRQVRREIEAAGGTVEYAEQGRGRARFEDEDPYLCRMVARWTA
jgi:SAM-dependent methyltransferase